MVCFWFYVVYVSCGCNLFSPEELIINPMLNLKVFIKGIINSDKRRKQGVNLEVFFCVQQVKYCRPSTSWETEWKIFKKCLLWDFSICSVSCPYEKGFPCSSHSNIVCPLKTRVVYSVKNSFCSIQGFMEEHVLPSNAWAMSFSLVINHLHHISQYTGNIDLWPEGFDTG